MRSVSEEGGAALVNGRREARCAVAAAIALAAAGACDRAAPVGPPPGRSVAVSARDADPAAEPAPVTSAAPAPPATAAPADPSRRPLEADGALISLAVEGHADAVVSVPLGAVGRRPVAIAAHGNYDRPEWQCEVWRLVLGDDVFILCPRGVPRPDSPSRDDVRFTYSSNRALEREIDAALAALRARFPDHAGEGAVLYTGFSLGAIMGAAIASRRPADFPRLVLVEGGHDKWTPAAAAAFGKGGGARVLFVCSQGGCAGDARQAAARLERAGVATRVARSKDVGHTYDGAVAEEARRGLPWVVEGDPRWAGGAP